MKINRTYKEIFGELRDPLSESHRLNHRTVLRRRIDRLPDDRWADMEIPDWSVGDELLDITYSTYDSPFGEVLIANTPKGVCYLGVERYPGGDVFGDFQNRFGYARPRKAETSLQRIACDYLHGRGQERLVFHLEGTAYQSRIWRRLLRIPYGKVIDYATLAGSKAHSRAAGAANGRNPIFYLVPCHRVVRTDGGYDRYSWGREMKASLLDWEFANSETLGAGKP